MKYNWDYFIKLGYEANELEMFEQEGWSKEIYELLSNSDLADNYQDNIRYLLSFFDRKDILSLMVTYTSVFMVSNKTFVRRIEQIAEMLGDDWCEIIWELRCQDQKSIFEAIGYLREDDWKQAVATISLLS